MTTITNLKFKDGDGDDGSSYGEMLGVNIVLLDDESYLITESYEDDDYTASFANKEELLKYLKELL